MGSPIKIFEVNDYHDQQDAFLKRINSNSSQLLKIVNDAPIVGSKRSSIFNIE
jgi:hypothetical protein